jgi:hypothetical protein
MRLLAMGRWQETLTLEAAIGSIREGTQDMWFPC